MSRHKRFAPSFRRGIRAQILGVPHIERPCARSFFRVHPLQYGVWLHGFGDRPEPVIAKTPHHRLFSLWHDVPQSHARNFPSFHRAGRFANLVTVSELTPINPDVRSAVEAQLERMLSTALFRRKPRVSSFLEYTVRQTLNEQHSKLKEYSIAVEVFKRPEDFDPRLDSIVRVEARRLRATVDRYYDTDGRDDSVFIRYRRGNYVPSFENRDARDRSCSLVSGGDLLIGVLDPDTDYSELAGKQSTASLTIFRSPLNRETVDMLRRVDGRLVLLKHASAEDLDWLIRSSTAVA